MPQRCCADSRRHTSLLTLCVRGPHGKGESLSVPSTAAQAAAAAVQVAVAQAPQAVLLEKSGGQCGQPFLKNRISLKSC